MIKYFNGAIARELGKRKCGHHVDSKCLLCCVVVHRQHHCTNVPCSDMHEARAHCCCMFEVALYLYSVHWPSVPDRGSKIVSTRCRTPVTKVVQL